MEVKQKTNEEKITCSGEKRFFGSFQHKQKQSKNKPQKQLRTV